MSVSDDLSQLARMHAAGDLTDDEFAAAKRQLLDGGMATPIGPAAVPASSTAVSDPPPPTPPSTRHVTAAGHVTARSRLPYDPEGLRTLGRWARWLTFATTGLYAVSLLAGFGAWSTYADFVNRRTTSAESIAADESMFLLYGLGFFAMIATGIVVTVWMWRLWEQTRVMTGQTPRHGRGWTIGGWVIPIGNLWIPKQLVDDLWRISGPGTDADGAHWSTRTVPSVLHWWWGLWVGGFLLGRVGDAMEPSSESGWYGWYFVVTLGLGALVASGVLFAHVVDKLNGWTRDRAHHVPGA